MFSGSDKIEGEGWHWSHLYSSILCFSWLPYLVREKLPHWLRRRWKTCLPTLTSFTTWPHLSRLPLVTYSSQFAFGAGRCLSLDFSYSHLACRHGAIRILGLLRWVSSPLDIGEHYSFFSLFEGHSSIFSASVLYRVMQKAGFRHGTDVTS